MDVYMMDGWMDGCIIVCMHVRRPPPQYMNLPGQLYNFKGN